MEAVQLPEACVTDGVSALTIASLPQPRFAFKRCAYYYYSIHRSENAIVYFCHDIVIKKLLPYKDKRYDQERLRDRHLCLLEGLKWNRKFTPGIHLGLARIIYDWKTVQNKFDLGELLSDPTIESLNKTFEYVLLMKKLPKEDRLDFLLNGKSAFSQDLYARLLSEYVADMHQHLDTLESPFESWGSPSQLKTKLLDNIDSVVTPKGVQASILHSDLYNELRSIANHLNKKLVPVFEKNEYSRFFIQRMLLNNIKRCHGDLKARNIWIIPSAHTLKMQIPIGVCILDTIDFNPSFCKIDILSDFAMLAVDIQVRTMSPLITGNMIEEYLHNIGQTDKVSRFVLDYYMVEKAFVGALVSIMYDNDLDLGEKYLEATRDYLKSFKLK